MFEKLRRPGRSMKEGLLKKWFSYFIFGLICLVFVFLVPMGTKLGGEGILGYVGSEPLRSREFRLYTEDITRYYQSRLDQADDENYSKIQKEIRDRALKRLVDLHLLVQGSQKAGFFLSDRELRSEIQSYPAFQKNGRFLYSRYLAYLKSQNLSARRFENQIRRGKLAQNWGTLFKKAVFSNTLEKEKKSQRHHYKVNFRYSLLNAGDIEEEKLESLVKSKNIKKINSFLKENEGNWEETGLFTLFSAFGLPIVQKQNVMDVLIDHLPSKGLIPRLIRENDKIYILDILSFEKRGKISPQDQQLENLLSRQFDKSIRLLDAWLDFQKQEFEIRLSNNI